MSRLVDFAVGELGGLDIMVNNAGIGEDDAPVDEKSAEAWNRIIGVNLTGAFYGVKHAARAMKKSGKGGVIVNMSSVLGVVGTAGAPAYIRTPLIAGIEDQVLPLHPIGRLGDAKEVASMVAYLVSDEAAFLTGPTYLVDGGYTAA